MSVRSRQGWQGWDEYAPFYDWENAQTLGRRDVNFWLRTAKAARGRILELGCGTGRIALPLARGGARVVGIDRSESMLARASRRAARLRAPEGRRRKPRLRLVRGDIRTLPFDDDSFGMVIAPYGIVQSLIRDRDLASTLSSVRRVLKRGGLFGIDLVPDVPNWKEYSGQEQLHGPGAGGVYLTLVESVRQDRRRGLTIFEQEYWVNRGSEITVHPFTLTFRTLPVKAMVRRLERAGFTIRALLGDYRGRPWDDRAEVWIILAEKV